MVNPYDDDESWLDTRPDSVPVKLPTQERLWVIHMSQHEVAANRALAEAFVCIGWVEAGELTQYQGHTSLKAAFSRLYPDEDRFTIANWAGDAMRFVKMEEGDLFVFPVTGEQDIHIGEITGNYQFRVSDADLVARDSANTRPVKWLATVKRTDFTVEAIKCFDSEHIVHSGDRHRAEVVQLLENATRAGKQTRNAQ